MDLIVGQLKSVHTFLLVTRFNIVSSTTSSLNYCRPVRSFDTYSRNIEKQFFFSQSCRAFWCYQNISFTNWSTRVLFQTVSQTNTNQDLIIYAATPANWPQRCILTNDSDCFSNSNFRKAQIVRSPMMVIKLKHVGAFLM